MYSHGSKMHLCQHHQLLLLKLCSSLHQVPDQPSTALGQACTAFTATKPFLICMHSHGSSTIQAALAAALQFVQLPASGS
jgi:hypothetical protein